MSADSVSSSKTNILQSKRIYCRHFRTYSRCAMFDWSDTVFWRRNVTRRRISNTVLQQRYWGREADSPEVCWLQCCHFSSSSSQDYACPETKLVPPNTRIPGILIWDVLIPLPNLTTLCIMFKIIALLTYMWKTPAGPYNFP
jgi:hypothetical protein